MFLGKDNKCQHRVIIFPKEGVHVKRFKDPIIGVKDILVSAHGDTTILEIQTNCTLSGTVNLFSKNINLAGHLYCRDLIFMTHLPSLPVLGRLDYTFQLVLVLNFGASFCLYLAHALLIVKTSCLPRIFSIPVGMRNFLSG